MPKDKETCDTVRFGGFELDLRSGELRQDSGKIVRLPEQPFQILAMLLERPREVIAREDIRLRLWPHDTIVEFEHSISAAMNRLRQALGDSADNPRFIETLPKRGYRFIGKIGPEPPVVMPLPSTIKPGESALAASSKKRPAWAWTSGLAAMALAVSVALLFIWLTRNGNMEKSEPLTAVPFTAYPGQETDPAISPDGSRIAFAWDSSKTNRLRVPAYDLYVKAIGSETLLRLTTHPSYWISPVWSPDGTQIAFHRIAGADTGIYVVPSLGGPERKLVGTQAPYDVVAPLSWSPDGKWIAYSDRKNGLTAYINFLLNVDTLETRELPRDPACIDEGTPTFSHSGKQLALGCVHSTANFEYFVADTEGKSKRSLATQHELPSNIAWSGDDKYLIVSRLFYDAFELDRIRVSDGRVEKIPLSTAGLWPSISADGRKLTFSCLTVHLNIWRKDLLHPETPPVQVYISNLQQNEAYYSPDGKHVAFDSNRSGIWSVWMADVDGSNLVQISHGRPAGFPRWSPDSQRIAYGSNGIYVVDIGTRVPRRLPTRLHRTQSPSWSRDGKSIYFQAFEGVGQQIYRSPAIGGDATLMAASDFIDEPVESPDGRTLYFMPHDSDEYLRMLPLDRHAAIPQPVPGLPKLFSKFEWYVVPNGIYFTPEDDPRSICFYDFSSRNVREIFRTSNDPGDGLSVSPDGRYMLYSQFDEYTSNIMLVSDFH